MITAACHPRQHLALPPHTRLRIHSGFGSGGKIGGFAAKEKHGLRWGFVVCVEILQDSTHPVETYFH